MTLRQKVNGCKTVQVAGNGVTMRRFFPGKSCSSLAVDYRLEVQI